MRKNNSVIKNIKLVFISQVIVLVASIIRTLLIPKIISVEEHGYWQTYLLYLSYISIIYLGYNDGIYLRYAKMSKEEIKEKKFSSSFFVFICISIREMIIGIMGVCFFTDEPFRTIYMLVIINIPITGIFSTVTYYLQITDRMKVYSVSVIIQRTLFIACLISLFVFDFATPYILMALDLLCLSIVTFFLIIKEREVLMTTKPDIKTGISEYIQNVKVGIKLMMGTYIALLLTGITRFFVSGVGSLEQFSYYSFALSITNVVVVCIGTLGVAIYPQIIKRPKELFGYYYNYMCDALNQIKPFIFLTYYFCYIIIKIILPKYEPALQFLALLFIVVMLQVKINVINNTYYKLLRKEKKMLIDNLISLIQLVICCIVIKDINHIIICQIAVLTYRVVKSEYVFRKELNIKNEYNLINTILPYGIFIISICLDFKIGILICFIYVIIHFIINYKKIINLIKLFLLNRRGENSNEKNYVTYSRNIIYEFRRFINCKKC